MIADTLSAADDRSYAVLCISLMRNDVYVLFYAGDRSLNEQTGGIYIRILPTERIFLRKE